MIAYVTLSSPLVYFLKPLVPDPDPISENLQDMSNTYNTQGEGAR